MTVLNNRQNGYNLHHFQQFITFYYLISTGSFFLLFVILFLSLLPLSFNITSHLNSLYNIQLQQSLAPMDHLHSNQLDNGDTIYYSIVQKQSQKGFSMNKRLLLMIEGHFISYLSQPNIHFVFTKDYISKNAKMIVPLSQINKVVEKREEKKIVIHFWIYEKKKRVEKAWSIRFGNEELLEKWLEKFEDETNRSRKGTERNGSISRQESNENNLQSAQKLIRRLSRQDARPEPIKSQPNIQNGANNYPQHNSNPPQQANPIFPRSTAPPYSPNNQSYFSNVAFVNPPSFKQPGETYEQAMNIQNSKMKDRSIYFSNTNFAPLAPTRYNFRNYYRPYLDTIIKNPNSIAKASHLTQASNKLSNFLEYSKQCVIAFIEQKLQKIKQLERYKDIKLRIKEDTPNWIKFNEFDDICIELGLIQLKNVKNENYICDGALTKIAMNNLKNIEYLYEVIGNDLALINTFFIPMACVVMYKGYTCFVTSKIVPDEDRDDDSQISDMKQTSKMFDRLSMMSKIGFQVFQNENFIKFTPKNDRKDKFVINYAKTYLPQLENCLILRKESFAAIYPEYQPQNYVYLVSKKESQYQIHKISKYLQEKIIQLSDLMNKLQVYPISPSQMSQILHCFGINVKYLSHLYNRITQFYIQSVIKTDAALRVFKLIFSKKLQENLGRNRRNLSQQTGKQLLNILLGKEEATSQLWKVVSLHAQMGFNLSIQQSEINKGYLLLGLNYYLNIQIFSNYPNIQKVFRVPNFVEAIKFHPKVKPPNVLPTFMKGFQEQYDMSMNQSLFNKTLSAFDLQDQPLPSFLTNYRYLYSKILFLLSFNINPRDSRYRHLKLYDPQTISQLQTMNSLNFFTLQRQMTEIKWEIKNGSKPEYILMLTNKIKDTIQNFYGKNHPFISEIYQLQSLYFLEIFEQEQSINVNKQSLSNMIQCCGNNNRHLKISNNYYQLGECLKKCYRFQESILNYKKAKNILEINSYQNLPQYALILYKLGLMYLLLNRDSQSYEIFMHAISIYQQSDIYSHWDSLVDLYEAIHRCQVKPTANKLTVVLSDVKLAQHCIVQLQKILIVEIEFQICSDSQFIRLFKIIAQQYISCIKRDQKQMFRDYILQLCDYFNLVPDPQSQPSISQSIVYFKSLISQGKFCELILGYMVQTNEILLRLKNDKRVGRLIPSRRNDLIENYDQFMKNMVVILGEPFILNII